ncbi:MAG: hypothetical protein HRT40_06920 [Campylobacteraceae bacterium]|nr:hypothetical protein [Campylobacteraceae bacterium]
MGLKKYIISSILLIIIIAGYVFSLEANDYTIVILDNTFTFPIAVWAIIPVVILFVASIFHMLFYGFRTFLNSRAVEKDEKNIVNLLKETLLENQNKIKFKTKTFIDLSSILSQLTFDVKNDFDSKDKDLNEIISLISKVNEGEYVSLKNYKFNKQGSIEKKNLINKINSSVDYALDIIKKSDTFSSDIVKVAFLHVLKEKSMTTINKILSSVNLDKEMTLSLFEKDKENADFSIGFTNIKKYAKEAKLDKKEYINLFKLYKDTFTPDELIKLFEELSCEDENSSEAYLYILFEFEMIDTLREVLDATSDKDFKAFRALLDLKDNSKHYTLETISYNS